jgi:hypothetical protein
MIELADLAMVALLVYVALICGAAWWVMRG